MSGTVVSTPPSGPPPQRTGSSTGDKIRFVLRGVGQLLITAGVVVLLFIVYEVWVTNIFAGEAQHKLAQSFTQQIEKGPPDGELPLPGSSDATIPLGSGVANIYLPRLGQDFHFTIVQGSDVPNEAQLDEGPAHYRGTQLPGELGNFAVAGHRVGKGEPFLNLDKLRPGDPVIIQTVTHWYVYRVKGRPGDISASNADGVPGREIVSPSDGEVLLPKPDHPQVSLAQATERLMTMTTCTPKFTAAKRMVVFAALDQSRTVAVTTQGGKAALAMPASIKALYTDPGN